MKINMATKIFLGLVLVTGAIVFSIFFRMYQHDTQALQDFLDAYSQYDSAISEFSKSILSTPDDELERKSEQALLVLKTNAAALSGISSLIKNDSVIPPTAKEIVDFSENELDQLRVIKSTIRNKEEMSTYGLDSLSNVLENLNKSKKDAFRRFRSLGE